MNLSQFEAHKNYIHGIDEKICRYMFELKDSELCEFVKITPSCHESDYKVNYLRLSFCELSSNMDRPKAALFMLSLALMLAFLISVLVYITTPNIVAIVKYLRLSEHNASTTALVLLNGFPDVITAFLFYDGDTVVMLNEMLGTGLYLWAFHGGIVMTSNPHALYGVYFMRDSIAYMTGLILQFNINAEHDTSVFKAIGASLFYPAYCFIVYVQHLGELDERRKAEVDLNVRSTERYSMIQEIEIVKYPLSSSDNPLDVDLWKQFLIVFHPFRSELYDNAATWQRFLLKAGLFITIPLKLVIPIVDLKMPGDGWSRLLFSINIFFCPLIMILTFDFAYIYPMFAVSLPLALLFFYVTTTDTPKYMFSIALYGAVCVTIIAHELETQIVAMAVALGHIISLRPPIIGFTINGWANTVPELILYWTLIRWNYKTLALMDFLMAPLFNMVLSLALTAILKSISQNEIYVAIRPGHVGVSGMWFIVIQHFLSSFAIISTNFHLRKSTGIYFIVTYFCYLTFIALYQASAIHAYGTDHVDEHRFRTVNWA